MAGNANRCQRAHVCNSVNLQRLAGVSRVLVDFLDYGRAILRRQVLQVLG